MVRPRSLATAALALCLMTACASDPEVPNGPTSASTQTSTTPVPTATGSGDGSADPDDAAGGGGEADGFEYVPWGPDAPPIPGHYAAMAASAASPAQCGDVEDLQPGGDFWATVVAVCQAVTGAGPWPAGTAVPDPPPAENAYLACLNTELADMVRRALRWRAGNPDSQPVVRYSEPGTTSPCQYRIYDVRILGEQDLFPDEDLPDGVALAITAADMDDDDTVTVDGQPTERSSAFDLPDPGGGLTTVVAVTEPRAQPRTVRIEVLTDRETLTAPVDLPRSEGDFTTTTDASPTDATSTDGASP